MIKENLGEFLCDKQVRFLETFAKSEEDEEPDEEMENDKTMKSSSSE